MLPGQIRYALDKPRGEDMPVIANFDVNTQIVKGALMPSITSRMELTPDYLCTFADDFWTHTKRRFSEDYLLRSGRGANHLQFS